MTQRQTYIAERRLIGPMTCRIGCCDEDGTCCVSFPAVQYSGPNYSEVLTRVGVWMCDEHAAAEVEKSKPKPRPRKSRKDEA